MVLTHSMYLPDTSNYYSNVHQHGFDATKMFQVNHFFLCFTMTCGVVECDVD